MIVVRKGVFETNSSSEHSLTLCDAKDFDSWKEGKLLMEIGRGYAYTNRFIPYEKESLETCPRCDAKMEKEYQFCPKCGAVARSLEYDDNKYLSYLDYENKHVGYLHEYEERYTTKSGDTVVAFGYFGRSY